MNQKNTDDTFKKIMVTGTATQGARGTVNTVHIDLGGLGKLTIEGVKNCRDVNNIIRDAQRDLQLIALRSCPDDQSL